MVQLPVDVVSDKYAGNYRDELIDNGMLDGFKSKLEAIKEDFGAVQFFRGWPQYDTIRI